MTDGHPWIARMTDLDRQLGMLTAKLNRDISELAAVQRWLILILSIETVIVVLMGLAWLWTLTLG